MSRPPLAERTHPVVALDVVRGLAAFCVFFAHIRGSSFVAYGDLPIAQRTPLVATFFALSRLGGEAVLIFFVLSGFLVGGQLLLRVKRRSFDLRLYTIDRATRILLPLVPICCLTAALNVAVFREPFAFGELIGNMVGLNGVLVDQLPRNAPLWSLAFEIWFYVVGGAVACLFLAGKKTEAVTAFGVILLTVGVFTALHVRFLLYWAIGAFTMLLLESRGKAGLGILGAILLSGGVLCRQLALASISISPIVVIPNVTAEALICGGFCLTLPLLCCEQTNRALRFLHKPAAAFAGISFTLFLSHVPIDALCDLFLPQMPSLSSLSIAYFLLRCGVCLGGTLVLYFLFERNTAALRRYITAKTTPAADQSGTDEPAAHATSPSL